MSTPKSNQKTPKRFRIAEPTNGCRCSAFPDSSKFTIGEIGWHKGTDQSAGDSLLQACVLFFHPTKLLPSRSDQPSRMSSCLRSCRLAGTPPLPTSPGGDWEGGLGLLQLTLAPRSCAKSVAKCVSRHRSERVINTPSPCALTNTLLYNLLLQQWQRNMHSVAPTHPSSLENLNDTLPYMKSLQPVERATGPVGG